MSVWAMDINPRERGKLKTEMMCVLILADLSGTVQHTAGLTCNSAPFGCLFIKRFGIEDRAVMELRITLVSQRHALIHLEAARCVWKVKPCHSDMGITSV